jgi:tetratricopeptide (TPR) repeat protein
MKKIFTSSNALIMILLLALILLPRPIFGYQSLGYAARYELAGDCENATQDYRNAAVRLPWLSDLWEKAGMQALTCSDEANAIGLLSEAVERQAITDMGWLSLGNAWQAQGHLDRAVAAWEQAQPLAQAWRLLASAKRTQGDLASAVSLWRTYISAEPDRADAHYALGLLLSAIAPEQALSELMLAASLNSEYSLNVQVIRKALNTAFLVDDRAYQFLVSGQALGALGEWDLAEAAFRNSIAIRSDYGDAWAWLAEAQEQQTQTGSFEIEQALKFDPRSAMVQGFFGRYLLRQNQPEAALSAFRKAAVREPNEPIWQMSLASALEQNGDLVAAYDRYLRAVQLAPQDATAWRALATFSVMNNVDVEATGLPAADHLIELASDDWQSYDLAGQADLLLEDYQAAEIFLKRAIQIAPEQAAPALHLGTVYLLQGDHEMAFSFLNLAVTLDPGGSYGWQAARLLETYYP